MLKILSAAQLRECDAYTIAHEPVTSIDLMERACNAFVSWFIPRFVLTKKIGVVCGTGNNGGDGLGIARLLKEWGYPVKIWVVKDGGKESPDFMQNLLRAGEITEITNKNAVGAFLDVDILIDAIFGSGISRPVDGIHEWTITAINQTDCVRIAVDIPSGLIPDQHTSGAVVHAHHTVTFQVPKLAFLFPENSLFTGEWHCVDIRLSKKFIRDAETNLFYLTEKDIRSRIKVRSKFDNKGDHGKALLIAGSYGKMGACILSAKAALRAGVGLLTVHVPGLGYPIIQTAVPEAMSVIDKDRAVFSSAGAVDKFTVVGIGPGIGQDPKTKNGLKRVMQAGLPMVIDADALNILGFSRTLLKKIPAGSILTPHPGEFARLTQPWADDFERLEKQKRLANETGAVVILKGAHTSIATPHGVIYFNSTGNPGMATGGAGDVLTGILTGLLAQGYSAEDASIAGVYLHGLAGDLAAGTKGVNSLIASDLVEFLPDSFKKTAP